MRDSMNHCLQKQPSTPHLPLPDYVDSAAVLEEIRAGARLTAAVASRRRPEREDAGTGLGLGLGLANPNPNPNPNPNQARRRPRDRRSAAQLCRGRACASPELSRASRPSASSTARGGATPRPTAAARGPRLGLGLGLELG